VSEKKESAPPIVTGKERNKKEGQTAGGLVERTMLPRKRRDRQYIHSTLPNGAPRGLYVLFGCWNASIPAAAAEKVQDRWLERGWASATLVSLLRRSSYLVHIALSRRTNHTRATSKNVVIARCNIHDMTSEASPGSTAARQPPGWLATPDPQCRPNWTAAAVSILLSRSFYCNITTIRSPDTLKSGDGGSVGEDGIGGGAAEYSFRQGSSKLGERRQLPAVGGNRVGDEM